MRRAGLGVIALLALIAISACGSATKTKTVTVAQTPPAPQTQTTPPAQAGIEPCSQVTSSTMECAPSTGDPCPVGYDSTSATLCTYNPSNDMAGDPGNSTGSTDTGNTEGTDTTPTPDVKSAAPGKWLKLATLHAKIAHVSITHEMSSDMGVKNAKGKFVVVSLSVTNHSDSPQRFDGIGGNQTALVLANQKEYSEDFDVGNGIDQNSFTWNSDDIQPDQTVTHDVIFDVPAHAVVSGGNLAVLNFGDDTSLTDDVSEIGSIDLGNLA